MIEEVNCSHYQYCQLDEVFNGCEKCKDFIFKEPPTYLKEYLERKYGIIIPYNYRMIFNRKVCRFWIKEV